jgi:hypothetical protein
MGTFNTDPSEMFPITTKVPHIGELSNQYKEELHLLFKIKPCCQALNYECISTTGPKPTTMKRRLRYYQYRSRWEGLEVDVLNPFQYPKQDFHPGKHLLWI